MVLVALPPPWPPPNIPLVELPHAALYLKPLSEPRWIELKLEALPVEEIVTYTMSPQVFPDTDPDTIMPLVELASAAFASMELVIVPKLAA